MYESKKQQIMIDSLQALVLLKQGVILIAASGLRTLFQGTNERIKVTADHASYHLSHSDFLELFQNEMFVVPQKEEFDVDAMKQKDEEYYGWKHK